MGKKRRTGKKEGVLLTILVLFCTFLTGCTLLDIKDGGLGMTNPDYVEPEEESTTSDHTESPDLGEFQKKVRLPGLRRRGKRHWWKNRNGCEIMGQHLEPHFWVIRQTTAFREKNIKELRPIRIWTGFQKTIS